MQVCSDGYMGRLEEEETRECARLPEARKGGRCVLLGEKVSFVDIRGRNEAGLGILIGK